MGIADSDKEEDVTLEKDGVKVFLEKEADKLLSEETQISLMSGDLL